MAAQQVIYILKNTGPNWAEIVTAIGTAVVALGLLGAAIQVRESRRSRYASIAVDIAKTWGKADLTEARGILAGITAEDLSVEFERLRNETPRPDRYFVLLREPNFFEWLGVLQRFGWIGCDWIEETVGEVLLESWEKWEITIDRMHAIEPTSALFDNFRDLAVVLDKRSEKRLAKVAKAKRRALELTAWSNA
jgi:hypothetical protein